MFFQHVFLYIMLLLMKNNSEIVLIDIEVIRLSLPNHCVIINLMTFHDSIDLILWNSHENFA